ncbi:hypothetical protein EV643_110213 [Kribbella sp. VKM Ac-2527]|uniref:Uncharacterized protein n=1 Tax=Kribbella caucasensis TaxID=2512215 RepID=A0A4R6KAK3_9ACTN|nr:hypothetical protein [Kribbella sp. VKM Ac-2527]TDO46830.1 hypothetical protein EV643_110213 [Kribbella sp. VKM Ac-2527]
MRRERRARRLGSPVVTIGTVGLLFAGAAALGVDDSTGTKDSKDFVSSVPWTVWRMVAAAAILLFLGMLLTAARVLAEGGKWGIVATPGRRWVYVAIAAAAIGAFFVFLSLAGGRFPDVPVKSLVLRLRAVLLTGMVASVPWLALVWLAHEACHSLHDRIESLSPIATKPEKAASPPASRAEPAPYREVIAQLLNLWSLLVLCVGAFALGVVAAIVTSGALRAAFIAAHPDRAGEFPAVNVLYYGALFAVLLSVLAVPLAASWRSCARSIVDHAYPLPPDGQPTEEWVASRARLEALLHLDVSLLRNPLTALTILSPLLTGALAAFIPELGRA